MHTGVYDSLITVYPDAMQRADVQCEACHGPASGHNGLINDSRMVYSLSAAVCSYCHDSGTHYVIGDQWKYSGDDASEFDERGLEGGHAKGTYLGTAGSRSGCSPCHSGAGFVEWVKEGRPLDKNGAPAATQIIPQATTHSCAVCHDPHDATNEHQLRMAAVTTLGDGTPVTFEKYGTGALCMQCHRSRVQASTYAENPDNASSHYGAHHGPEADLLLGVNAPNFGINFPSSPHAVAVLPGEDHTNACVNCHMAGPALDANNNPNLVGGHTWNMNDAEGHDNVGACAPCHGDIGTSFSDKKYYINGNADLDGNGVEEGLQIEVKGLVAKLAALLPQNASGDVTLTPGDSANTPSILKGAYVYFWIVQDRSWGIHNPAFTVALLKAAIEQLGGVVAVDYPKDNMPQEYKLAQNYPNPFNPSTTIQYTIPEHSMVTLTIYDALGKQIEQLFSGEKAPGTYSVQWNASNYSSGIYFYRLTADKFVQVKKMLLLK
jgi:Secretion system C-terminal sorting domain